MKKIGGFFIQGLIYIAPLGITIYIVYMIFTFFDKLLEKYIDPILPTNIPGINLVVVLVFIVLLGFVGQTIIARPIKSLATRLLDKAPLIKVIYSAIRDLLTAFVGKEKKFSNPVLVKVNHLSNLEKLGFLTQEDLSNLGILDKKVAVYFPHSYNFSGELFIVPTEHVRSLENVSSGDIMKYIVSGGASGF